MNKRKLVAILITVILLGLILHKISWAELIQTFKTFDCKNIIPIAFLYIISLYLRGIRWKWLFLDDEKYSSSELAKIFTVGSMLNVFLPARAGDLYRAYYLGHVKHEKKMKVFGSVILERMFDGLSVFFILLTAVIFYCKQPWILNLSYIIGAIFIGCLVFAFLIFKYNKIPWIAEKLGEIAGFLPDNLAAFASKSINKISEYANNFIQGFEVLSSFKYSVLVFIQSMVIWMIECYIAYLVFVSFNLDLGISASFFVISLTSFSSMIPSTSIFLGPYQYAYILALNLYGIEKSVTLAVSTVHQGILTLVLTLIGGIYLLKFNSQMQNFQNKTESE